MSNPNRNLPYSRQWIDDDDIRAVLDVLKSDYITQGPKVGEFEAALARYCGAQYAVVFATGTAALHAAYYAAGLKPGEEIITSPITFAATSNAALYLRASPVFVDIEPDTGNIDPRLIEEKITSRTRLIAPVHFSGHPVDLDGVHEIARRHHLLVVEDACHALGAKYKGRKIGSLSDMTAFSFHPVKPITTAEGGAVLTNNEQFYTKLRLFSSHGITRNPNQLRKKNEGPWYSEMLCLGYNFRITDIQCALGISQLGKLDSFLAGRRKIVSLYQEAFLNDTRILIPREKNYASSSWHLLSSRLSKALKDRRRDIFEALHSHRIMAQVHYIPVYLHPYYQDLGFRPGLCPCAEEFYESEISLPVFYGMTGEETLYAIETLKDILSRYS